MEYHAVGRDHMPWYNRQRPDLFADALAGAKGRLDPKGMVRIRLSDSSSAEFNPSVGSTTSGVFAAQEAARGVLSDLQGTFKKSAKSRGHLGG